MSRLTYICDFDGTTLKFRGHKQLIQELQANGWHTLVVTLDKKAVKRSLPQNAYYHAAIIPILQQGMKELGHVFSKETVHEMMKAKFLKEDILLNEHGEYITRIKHTPELSKSEFGEYIDQIIIWAAEYLHVTIPPPSTQTELYE